MGASRRAGRAAGAPRREARKLPVSARCGALQAAHGAVHPRSWAVGSAGPPAERPAGMRTAPLSPAAAHRLSARTAAGL